MGLSADILEAARRYGRTVDPLARERYGISGESLLKKLIQGESGGRSNAVSSVGARGLAQFMPETRRAVMDRFGIDPWRTADEAVHAASLHLRGKLGHRTGLEGYNPGDPKYASYILRQRVTRDAGGDTGATAGPVSASMASSEVGRGGLATALRALEQAQEKPQTPVTAPQAPGFAPSVALPEGYAPVPQPQEQPEQADGLQAALDQLKTLRQGGGLDVQLPDTDSAQPSQIQGGGQWAGTQRVAQTARQTARQFG